MVGADAAVHTVQYLYEFPDQIYTYTVRVHVNKSRTFARYVLYTVHCTVVSDFFVESEIMVDGQEVVFTKERQTVHQ